MLGRPGWGHKRASPVPPKHPPFQYIPLLSTEISGHWLGMLKEFAKRMGDGRVKKTNITTSGSSWERYLHNYLILLKSFHYLTFMQTQIRVNHVLTSKVYDKKKSYCITRNLTLLEVKVSESNITSTDISFLANGFFFFSLLMINGNFLVNPEWQW